MHENSVYVLQFFYIFDLEQIIVISSIMQINQAKKNFKNSAVTALPEKFVTVQIQNQQVKKKYRHYRDSIINQIKVTQDRVEETLNKPVRLSKSKFNYKITCDSSLGIRFKRLKQKQKTIIPFEKQYSFSPEVGKKLLQLNNISNHFQRACLPKQKLTKFTHVNQISYILPVVNAEPVQSSRSRHKQQRQEQRTVLNEWRQKVKLGRNYVTFLKQQYPLKFKLKNQKFDPKEDQNKQKFAFARKSLKSLRDVYFSPLKVERKSTPAQLNNLSLLVCQKKANKSSLAYHGSIEAHQARRLQQFVEGGALKQTNQYTHYLSIPQFMKGRQNFKTLDTIYNHVKDKTINQFKDLSVDSFDNPSMLSVVYYVENGHNMTQAEKKAMRLKLKFSD